jgi:hypothetical protein
MGGGGGGGGGGAGDQQVEGGAGVGDFRPRPTGPTALGGVRRGDIAREDLPGRWPGLDGGLGPRLCPAAVDQRAVAANLPIPLPDLLAAPPLAKQ